MVEVHLEPLPHKAETLVFGWILSEYHTGYRAFRRDVLQSVNFAMNSDKFIFDQEILAHVVNLKFRISEAPVPTPYFAEASSASFSQVAGTGCPSSGCWRATSCTAAAWFTSGRSTAWNGATDVSEIARKLT